MTLLNHFRIAWWRWALSEINPLHKDVPYIVSRINQLERP